ncbi:hypothetical protein [Streptomyces halobius]|uniref:Uncharacterized protein n=1 Tax=Streptomyces halobius TaxID=2879846 RepID=A0ABY4MAL3_9ACTN|nr:hypothetical protein [Streptomyces halobius]UQA94782.1 hypothetical protein K9S39_25595 [Streptomyces halobius]
MTRAKQALALAAMTIAVTCTAAAPALAESHTPHSGSDVTVLDRHIPISGALSEDPGIRDQRR